MGCGLVPTLLGENVLTEGLLKEPQTMKRVTVLTLALAFFAAACGDDSPTNPSQQNRLVFSAALSGANEVPPISNAEAGGTGNATITFDVTRDSAGNITAATTTFVVNIAGLPANTPINLSHIHESPAGVNGPVVVNTGLTAAAPVVLSTGSGSFERSGIAVTPIDVLTRIIANPAGFYFNSHSTLNGGGVVRGQLSRVQ
jgi:hypothetical protein